LFVFVVCAAIFGWYSYYYAGKRVYLLDCRNWPAARQETMRLNAFWLIMAERKETDNSSESLLAQDLRHVLIEQSDNAGLQVQSLSRLRNGYQSYDPLPGSVYSLTQRIWITGIPNQDFLSGIEKVRQKRIEELLLPLPSMSDPNDAKYDYLDQEWLRGRLALEHIIGLWAGITLLAALMSGLFRSRGWLSWNPQDAFYKTWLVIMFAPTMVI